MHHISAMIKNKTKCSKILKSQTFRKDLGGIGHNMCQLNSTNWVSMSGRSSALSERWPWPDALGVPPWTAGNAWFLDRCWRGPCRWSSCGWHHYVDAGMLPGLWWGWLPTRCGLAYPIISHYHYLPLLFPYSPPWTEFDQFYDFMCVVAPQQSPRQNHFWYLGLNISLRKKNRFCWTRSLPRTCEVLVAIPMWQMACCPCAQIWWHAIAMTATLGTSQGLVVASMPANFYARKVAGKSFKIFFVVMWQQQKQLYIEHGGTDAEKDYCNSSDIFLRFLCSCHRSVPDTSAVLGPHGLAQGGRARSRIAGAVLDCKQCNGGSARCMWLSSC